MPRSGRIIHSTLHCVNLFPIAAPILQNLSWACAMVPGLLAIWLALMPRSPYFLLSKGHVKVRINFLFIYFLLLSKKKPLT